MNPLQRSRRLQTGLASLGIVSAVGASFGIGAASHHASTGGTAGGSGAAAQHRSGSATSPQTSGSHHRSSSSSSRSHTPAPLIHLDANFTPTYS